VNNLFRVEKGHWYVPSSEDWGEWAVFLENIEKPIMVCKESSNGEEVAKYIAGRLNSLDFEELEDLLENSESLAKTTYRFMNEGYERDWKAEPI